MTGSELITTALESIGISVLTNSFVMKADLKLIVAGFGDYSTGHFQPGLILPDLERLRGEDDQLTVLAMAHNPKSFKQLQGGEVDLVCCGHTHGGQV